MNPDIKPIEPLVQFHLDESENMGAVKTAFNEIMTNQANRMLKESKYDKVVLESRFSKTSFYDENGNAVVRPAKQIKSTKAYDGSAYPTSTSACRAATSYGNEAFIDDTSLYIMNRTDFISAVDRNDLTPALLVTDRKADTLLTKVIETAADDLQILLSTGVEASADYAFFKNIVTNEDEVDAEIPLTVEATQVIDRMVNNAKVLLLDAIDVATLSQADLLTVKIDKDRVEITISK